MNRELVNKEKFKRSVLMIRDFILPYINILTQMRDGGIISPSLMLSIEIYIIPFTRLCEEIRPSFRKR
jgi:hypothetical protein